MRFESEQSRTLRREAWRRMIASLAVFTLAYIAIALVFNARISPALGDALADATTNWRYFSDAAYHDKTTAELLDAFMSGAPEGEHWEALASDEEMAAWEGASFASGADAPPFEGVTADEAAAIDLDPLAGRIIEVTGGGTEEGADVETTEGRAQEDAETTAALANDDDERTQGLLLATEDADGSMRIVPYTRRFLMDALLEREYAEAQRAGGSWIRGSEYYEDTAEGTIHSFAARDLSAYKTLRELKWPLLALGYIAGILVIAFATISRMTQRFDALASGIKSVLTERDKPIELPSGLSIAQGELNSIRLQSLSDERAAQAAERRKDELVAYLAHDIRTPLTSIIGYLSLLDEAPDLPPAVRKRYIATTERKAERLEALVEEFFEITKYNLQGIPIERRNVDARLLLEQLIEELYPQAEEKDIAFELRAPADRMLFADPDQLARALGNILRNAVSYADAGTRIRVEATPPDEAPAAVEGDARWRIDITDNGREIAEAHLERIFEKFYREDSARGSSTGGTGLGLAIAREIVVSHGGEVFARSAEGTTTFTVLLPAAPKRSWG